MAKLEVMPRQAIISGFKGKIDYYVYMGTPCTRKWPRSPGHRRTPAVEAQWPAFTNASRLWTQLSPEVQAAYNALATGSGLSGRDMFSRSYLTGLYRYPTGD